MNIRELALKALYEIEINGAYSNIAVKNALSHNRDISQQDKALFTNIVYGVTDKQLNLDYYIKSFSKLKMKKISKYILIILRMGIYQLKYMDRIPDSAAVNESVKLAKRYGHGASAGFVNGILRSVIKTPIDYPKEKNEYLSVKYSYPIWICDKWLNEFGSEFTESMMQSTENKKKITLRPNIMKTDAEELVKLLSEQNINASVIGHAVVTDGFDIEKNALYQNGYFTPQDIAAMNVAEVLEPKSGETIIDMCAAPGGKTTHIAEIMQNEGKIFAFDKYEHKTELIKKNAARLGLAVIEAEVSDAQEYNKKLEAAADRILCDVPCSGLGIIGRKPDIKWNRSEDENITEIQKTILKNAAAYLKTGGTLVYSTCTIEKEENECITSSFLNENDNFEKTYEKTFYPHIDGTDGFYICRLRKIK